MLRFQRFASSYAQAQAVRKYPVGGIFHGYEVRRILPVPELRLTAVDLVHSQTGAEHLHIDRDDKNNVFSIAFKTNPPDSTGVPHILEHTTLCGSVKYPVRDPFFKMLNKSLANFMNAMTGPDYTFFPFSTTNPQDFANLRGVYLDSTLNPLLKQEDFDQEGWRLEHKNITDPESNIVFKGVVYNEMKGQISNANYYFWSKFQQSIYPSLNNSGGDPMKITDLKYGDLLDFHHKNYHPSNAKTFTYGNLPLVDTLKQLNEQFSGYGKRARKDKLLMPIDLKKDIDVKLLGQIDTMLPPEKQTKASMTWICGAPQDTYDTFLLKVLGNLLMDGHSSVMYQKLIESGIGLEFSVNSGVEPTTAVNLLTVGIQGVSDIEIFKDTVNNIFQNLLETEHPFDRKRIDAIIEQLELSKKDQKADFGLQLLYSILPGWTNKIDPFESLLFEDVLQRFRGDLETKGDTLFQDLIRKYIVHKPCFTFSIQGSEEFSKSLDDEEQTRLREKITALDEQDKKNIFKRGILLQEKQNEKEDLSCLPTLQIKDIPRAGDKYSIEQKNNTMSRITDTNGITYVRGKRLLNDIIPFELFPYLPLFAESLTNLGTTTESFSEIEDQVKLHTGGISTHVEVTSDPNTTEPRLIFGFDGWSLNSKTDHIFEFWSKILLETDFHKNSDKLKVLIRLLASSNTSSVADSGHAFARGYSAAHYRSSGAINETLNGIEQLQFINRLHSLLDNEETFQREVVDKLTELQKYIVDTNNMNFFITSDSDVQAKTVESQISKFMERLPHGSYLPNGPKTSDYPLIESKCKHTLIKFPFQVHYTSQALLGVPYTHKDGSALQVMSNMLTFKHLHREVREKGGAYGGGASYSALAGIFSFYSYRDPQPLKSLETFKNSGRYILNDAKWGVTDLDEAKLTIFQQVDAPKSPKGEGVTYFMSGVTDDMKQARREQLLDVSLLDVHRVAEKYLLNKEGVSTVIGPGIEGKTVSPNWEVKEL
ncbi:BAH_G0012430.mRNA.1.CDS.1 [Saccharomyces cerevisiae]|nr:SX2_G0047620.mRNA.1.CDS.1 [Saccharomyces cerevisiae]CAI4368430.1 BAH_G0012430.mRNA.1.CDS.1 [Saccharomyces cerevisiae]CAI4368824.1 BAG_1a_G0012570.mRNA.1.CDS.1 [Saccharomyces cerevisiae]CAI7082767.1 BAH_G0012430.mRNA.1.CDS.1 [Saccharomyces cerevisiae]CAI7083334.1 BAG_1a_G0012570.mRNA.1.CDS.1 [Saccharomyces cerevisiae]